MAIPKLQSIMIHRCHLPVITNEDCLFLIDKVPYHFKPNFAFEFNNQKMHGVINNSNADRVHLICDILDWKVLKHLREDCLVLPARKSFQLKGQLLSYRWVVFAFKGAAASGREVTDCRNRPQSLK